jgi:hypothetical protein
LAQEALPSKELAAEPSPAAILDPESACDCEQ